MALRGELSANTVAFCRLLRQRGFMVGPGEATLALQTLREINLSSHDQFYMALRTTLAKSPSEQAQFDELFHDYWMVWDRASDMLRQQQESEKTVESAEDTPRQQSGSFVNVRDWFKGEDPEDEEEVAGFSPIEVLTQRDFAHFQADELEDINRAVVQIAKRLAKRLNRRYRLSNRRGGQLDLRRTLRRNLGKRGDLIDLRFKRRRPRRLKLVLLCDVSRSMDLYSRFLIQFIYAFQRAYRRIETFAFSTGLYRLTELLRSEDMDGVLAHLPEHAPGWSGGTRIGASLDHFLAEHGDRLLDPHTVVFILSDGWDTGEAERLAAATEGIRARCRCLIWLNPLLGNESYRPETKGMLAALSHVDLFAPAHNLASLRALAGIVGQLRGSKSMPRARRGPRPWMEQADAATLEPTAADATTATQPERPTTTSNLRDLAARQLQKRKDFRERNG
jgi:uncharacterized protein with von Willebrand factor type A (vWA) domain